MAAWQQACSLFFDRKRCPEIAVMSAAALTWLTILYKTANCGLKRGTPLNRAERPLADEEALLGFQYFCNQHASQKVAASQQACYRCGSRTHHCYASCGTAPLQFIILDLPMRG